MTKPLDPEIKALRAINRALAALPDDAAVRRVMEWTVARAAGKGWISLPRLHWVLGRSSGPSAETVALGREVADTTQTDKA